MKPLLDKPRHQPNALVMYTVRLLKLFMAMALTFLVQLFVMFVRLD